MASNKPSSSSEMTPSPDELFYCHTCNRQVDQVESDFACPECHQGFLEKVSEAFDENSDNIAVHDGSTVPQTFRQMMTNLSQNREQGTAHVVAGFPPDTLNMFLQQLVHNLQNVGGAGAQIEVHFQHGSGQAVFNFPTLHGNVDDYAWGTGGLDQVVTQLLNQFEGGAPPMTKDEIGAIPKVKVCQKQADSKMQCTTCMDDFSLDEQVLQLSCGHCFHDDCITPWLQRHNTCPICRKTVGGQQSSTEKTPSPVSSENEGGRMASGSMMDTIDELD